MKKQKKCCRKKNVPRQDFGNRICFKFFVVLVLVVLAIWLGIVTGFLVRAMRQMKDLRSLANAGEQTEDALDIMQMQYNNFIATVGIIFAVITIAFPVINFFISRNVNEEYKKKIEHLVEEQEKKLKDADIRLEGIEQLIFSVSSLINTTNLSISKSAVSYVDTEMLEHERLFHKQQIDDALNSKNVGESNEIKSHLLQEPLITEEEEGLFTLSNDRPQIENVLGEIARKTILTHDNEFSIPKHVFELAEKQRTESLTNDEINYCSKCYAEYFIKNTSYFDGLYKNIGLIDDKIALPIMLWIGKTFYEKGNLIGNLISPIIKGNKLNADYTSKFYEKAKQILESAYKKIKILKNDNKLGDYDFLSYKKTICLLLGHLFNERCDFYESKKYYSFALEASNEFEYIQQYEIGDDTKNLVIPLSGEHLLCYSADCIADFELACASELRDISKLKKALERFLIIFENNHSLPKDMGHLYSIFAWGLSFLFIKNGLSEKDVLGYIVSEQKDDNKPKIWLNNEIMINEIAFDIDKVLEYANKSVNPEFSEFSAASFRRYIYIALILGAKFTEIESIIESVENKKEFKKIKYETDTMIIDEFRKLKHCTVENFGDFYEESFLKDRIFYLNIIKKY